MTMSLFLSTEQATSTRLPKGIHAMEIQLAPLTLMNKINSTMVNRALTAVLVLSLGSCSNTPNINEASLKRMFKTLITEQGIKRFEINVAPKRRKSSNNNYELERQPSRRISERRLTKLLDTALKQTQYCREGYLLLGRYAGRKTNRLRGECKEIATQADKLQYENSIIQW